MVALETVMHISCYNDCDALVAWANVVLWGCYVEVALETVVHIGCYNDCDALVAWANVVH